MRNQLLNKTGQASHEATSGAEVSIPRKGRRAAEPPLPPSHRLILELLIRFRYLTTSGVLLAYEKERGRGAAKARKELRVLHQRGLVARHYYPVQAPELGGSVERVYVATLAGAKRVLEPEKYRAAKKVLWNRTRRKSNIRHLLLGSALHLLLRYGGKGWELERFVSDQEDQRGGIRFDLEPWQVVEREKLSRRRRHWDEAYVHPDATALIRLPDGKRLLYVFELDRTHKEANLFRWRFEDYSVLVTNMRDEVVSQWEQDLPGGKITGVIPVVVVPRRQDLGRMIGYAKEAIRSLRSHGTIGSSDRPLFLFWAMEDWFGQGGFREPRETMDEERVATLTGKRGRLVVGR